MIIGIPNRKVTVNGLAGAVLTIVFAILPRYGINVAPDTAVACATVVGFCLAYMVRD